ncbi:MAG TPA: hypothetical protein VFP70_10540, partial [Burkholderiales bacterium]|nr:hypothetical protein [Burkholderiales bacterium]
PGHYMRRIKTVSLSVPCVTGPYAGVSCKLTLLRNQFRHSPEASASYRKATTGDDPRFEVRYGASESIVTSSGRDDSGLFETLLRDDRYLPFESAGAVSTWRLELPRGTSELDFDTISDVILHMRYTARDGGDDLRAMAQQQWLADASGSRPVVRYPLLLSCRVDFAAEWARAKSSGGPLQVQLDLGLLPYWMNALGLSLRKVSTLNLPIADPAQDASFVATERWPASGQVPPIRLNLRADGTGGSADLGALATGTEDVLLFLECGNG